jgi:hypothetical protein
MVFLKMETAVSLYNNGTDGKMVSGAPLHIVFSIVYNNITGILSEDSRSSQNTNSVRKVKIFSQ